MADRRRVVEHRAVLVDVLPRLHREARREAEQKRNGERNLEQIVIVVDDFADSDVLQRNSNSPLTTLMCMLTWARPGGSAIISYMIS